MLKQTLLSKHSLVGVCRRYSCSTVFFTVAVLAGIFDSAAQDQPTPEKLLAVWMGTLPIILSAPHGGREPIPGISVRKGIGVAQFTTERDSNTDELAQKTAAKLSEILGGRPHLIIARFERKYLDANRAENGAYESAAAKPYYLAYHRALEQACAQVRRTWGRGLLLDIHGQGAEVETIFRGTDQGRSVAALERLFGREALAGQKSVLGQMAQRGYKIVPPVESSERERRYTGGYTTQTYGSHGNSGIDAIQLEFGTRLRARTSLERTAADLADAVVVFARTYLPAVRLTAGTGSVEEQKVGVVE